MSFIDSSLSAEKRTRSQELGYELNERRVPFTQREAAGLAGDNVVEQEAELPEIIDLAVELIRAYRAKCPTKGWRKIRRLVRKTRKRQIDASRYEPLPWDGDALTFIQYLETQLSPAGNQKIIDQVGATLGLPSPTACATEIRTLPADLRKPLVGLDMSLLHSALARSVVDCRPVEARFRAIWKYRLVAVAQRQASALADAAREPNGFRVAGPVASPSMAHIFLRAVTAPAMVVNRIAALLPTLSLPEDDD
ncbi:hypothetical protein [Sphingomonas sp.]|uniref:hypothetical protein n=1 Tax=Sphingomonas sp. TaxID=28214 RepID=UPI003B002A5C